MKNVDAEYIKYVESLIGREEVKRMKQYIQHGTTTTYDHCLKVSYYSYCIAKHRRYLKCSPEACAVGGLLHDFFLYDWHDKDRDGKREFKLPHGFTHGVVAERNARKYFDIDDRCSDIIKNHMFPLTIWGLPRYRETWLVLSVDKWLSTAEVFKRKKRIRKNTKKQNAM